ncbi:hypothetical protein V3H46_25530 [Vibrio parahaemolyticus]|uniref:hypothetical protein n=1 Tax=Vibrio parahaemolyticus TaxID=670 RepID=UPI00296CA6B2|nr:hypothetical protein [Vibrio parahaemolyticus]
MKNRQTFRQDVHLAMLVQDLARLPIPDNGHQHYWQQVKSAALRKQNHKPTEIHEG